MTSVTLTSTMSCTEAGTARVTKPAPPRNAPRAARTAAPVNPGDPATTNTLPKWPLWVSGLRGLMCRAMALLVTRSISVSTDPVTAFGMEISATTRRPQ